MDSKCCICMSAIFLVSDLFSLYFLREFIPNMHACENLVL